MMTTGVLLAWAVGVAASSVLAVWGHMRASRRWVHAIFKPLTTTLILVMLLQWAPTNAQTSWFALGLLLSIMGDGALIARRMFVLGLACFLVALLCYATAFSINGTWSPFQLVYLVLPATIAIAIAHSLWPDLGKLRFAVGGYIAALTAMLWRAMCRFDAVQVSLLSWLLVTAGALLFMAGDALLARRRFQQMPIPYAVELGTYHCAQFCLVTGLVWP